MTEKKSFNERCYLLLRQVPKGRVTTYAELARGLKSKAYRAVGNAMNKNPYAPKVPCHRVVKSDGTLGGYAKGPKAKINILAKEGVKINSGRVENFEKILFRFTSPRRVSKSR